MSKMILECRTITGNIKLGRPTDKRLFSDIISHSKCFWCKAQTHSKIITLY